MEKKQFEKTHYRHSDTAHPPILPTLLLRTPKQKSPASPANTNFELTPHIGSTDLTYMDYLSYVT